MRLRYSKSWKF